MDWLSVDLRIPGTLLRIFDRTDYAAQFVGGRVRVGRLDVYRGYEDSRRDATEGKVTFRWDLEKPVDHERSSMNVRYILCTSHHDVNQNVIKKFGDYIVRIDDPQTLLKRIDAAWQKHPLACGRCKLQQVIYNKDELLQPVPGLLPPIEYSYGQKPASFRDEREFRYVLSCTADAIRLAHFGANLEDHIQLELSDCSDTCSLS